MAIFNPEQRPTADPSYNRLSEGTGIDKTYANLFSGAGEVISGAASVAKDAFIEHIKLDAEKGLSDIRDNQAGVNEAVAAVQHPTAASSTSTEATTAAKTAGELSVAGNPTGKMAAAPGAVKRLGAQIDRLATAAEQNPGMESYYQAQVVALTRQLRAQYPGWRDEVDAVMSAKTGGIDANTLRRQLQLDAEKEQAKAQSQTDKRTQWLMSNEKYLPAGWQQMPFENVFNSVVAQKGIEHNIDMEKSALALKKARGEASEEDFRRTSTNVLDNYVTSKLASATTTLSGGNDIVSMVRDAQAKGLKNTPEDIAKIRQEMGRIRSEIELGIENVGSQPLTPGKPDTLKSSMKPEQWEAVKKQSLNRIAILEDALVNQNFGVLAAIGLDTKGRTNQATNEMIRQSPIMARLAAAKEMGLQDVAGNLLLRSGQEKALSEVVNVLYGKEILNTVTGQGPKTLKGEQDEAQRQVYPRINTAQQAQAEKQRIDGHVRLLTDPATPPEVAQRAAQKMFNEETLNYVKQFKPSEQQKVFSALFSGDVTKKMASIREQDPDLFYSYKRAATQAAYQVGASAGQLLQSSTEDQRFETYYDQGSGLFGIKLKAPFDRPGQADRMKNQMIDRVAPINRLIQTLQPIWKADGSDAAQQTMELVQSLGYDPSKASTFQPSTLQSLGNKLKDFLAPEGQTIPRPTPDNPSGLKKPVTEGNLSLEDSPNPLIQLVHKAESGGNYNAFWGAGDSTTDLSKLTLGEVRNLQRERVASGAESGAVGAFQIIGKTMDKLTKRLGLTGNEKFTPELQDRLAGELFKDAGIEKFRQGDISKKEFLNNLSKIWAGIPNSSGKSTYAGVGSNKATVTVDEALKAIDDFVAQSG